MSCDFGPALDFPRRVFSASDIGAVVKSEMDRSESQDDARQAKSDNKGQFRRLGGGAQKAVHECGHAEILVGGNERFVYRSYVSGLCRGSRITLRRKLRGRRRINARRI